MPLTEEECQELDRLEAQFQTGVDTCQIMIQGERVYALTFDAALVAEDERYEYLGKFDDLVPGQRIGACLGSTQEYARLAELRRRASA